MSDKLNKQVKALALETTMLKETERRTNSISEYLSLEHGIELSIFDRLLIENHIKELIKTYKRYV